MKQILFVLTAFILCGNLFSQSAPSYRFRKPTVVNATTWKFWSVAPGVNAIVTITGSNNATLYRIDDSSSYAYAWQPFIRITNATNSYSDSSYIDFKIEFQKSTNNNSDIQNKLAMTIVDCDGNNSLREFVMASLPSTSMNTLSSTITQWTDDNWLNSVSGSANYSNIDTTNYSAMSQVNFKNVSSYTIRLGVFGTISANSTRQFSFYFKPFSAMVVALPVSLVSFESKLNLSNSQLTWSTSSEENLGHFEIYRSLDGKNYIPAGKVNAIGNSKDLVNYNFTDYNVTNFNSAVVYYKLKMIDNEGNYKWSNITQVRLIADLKPASVNVFPNPTTEIVYLTLSEMPASDIQVSIVDAFGKTIQTVINPEMTSNNVISFDVKNFENGIYFINIQNADGSSTSSKFIKR